MANIFQMFGEIMVDNKKANTGIDETTTKGKHLGTTMSDVTDKIGKGFAAAGAAAAAMATAVGAAVVGAAKSLTNMTIGAAEYADEILTMSTVTGMSTEALQAYKYAAELVDVPLETLTKTMAKQIKSMASAADGSDKMVAAYDKLGVKVTDANGNLRDSNAVYWEAIDALGKMTNETERDALSMQIFGKSAQELNPLIEQGSAGIAKLTDEAKNMGAVMSDDILNALGKFDDTVQRLKSGSEAAKNAMGTILLPQLQSLADDGVTLLGDFTRGLNEAGGDFGKISDVIGNAIGGIASSILKNLPKIMEVATDIVMSLVDAIVENIPVVVETASTVVSALLEGIIDALPDITDGAVQLLLALVEGIVENLPALAEAAAQMIVTLVTGIGAALPKLVPAIVQVLVTVVQTIVNNLPLLLDAGLKLITGLMQGILAALPVLIDALPDIIIAVVDFFIGAIPQIIEAGIQLLTALIDALPTIIKSIVAAIPKIIDGIISAVVEAIPLLIDAGIKLLVSLVENLPLIISTICLAIPEIIAALIEGILGNIDKFIEAGAELFIALVANAPKIIIEIVKIVPKIIQALIDKFASFGSKMAEIGENLLKGIWEGIEDAGQWLWDKISGFFTTLTDKIKDFFGIHSPSTVFAGMGDNMGKGLGIGFVNRMKSVTEDMKNAIPTDLNMEYGITGRYGTTGAALLNASSAKSTVSGGAIANQPIVININSPTIMRASDIDWLMEMMTKNLKLKGVATA